MLILIDNGHGNNTPGKRSPDNSLLEYKYTREIAARVASKLRRRGYNAELLVPEIYDIPLLDRVHRVNVKCGSHGRDEVILVSIHCNAAGDGKEWKKATGWEAWTSPGETRSDILARYLLDEAIKAFPGKKIRVHKPNKNERDKEAAFTILQKTMCPAVLTENFFMDNKEDVEFLLSEAGKAAVVDCHVNGIMFYLRDWEQE